MKTSFCFGALLAIVGLAAAPLVSKAQTTSTSTSTTYVQTSKIIGSKVKTAQGEEVGQIKDVVLDRNTGCMAYTVLSTGGTGARVVGQAKTVAVPWTVYSVTSDPTVYTVRVERDRIYSAPVFDYARIEEYSRPDYINNVYSYYGVSAQAGGSGSTSVTGSTTTATGAAAGATLTSSPSASPAATTATGAVGATSPTATPSPLATASASVSASPSATASAAATASPRATRGAGREASPGEKTKSTPAASPSRRGAESSTTGREKAEKSSTTSESSESMGTTGEAKSESAGSPSGEHKKRSKGRIDEGAAESSATPKTTEEQE